MKAKVNNTAAPSTEAAVAEALGGKDTDEDAETEAAAGRAKATTGIQEAAAETDRDARAQTGSVAASETDAATVKAAGGSQVGADRDAATETQTRP